MSFSEDWSEILKLEKELRPLNPLRRIEWSLRVYLYSDGSGLGCDTYHQNQHWDNYTPKIDGFFPLFKADLKKYLGEVYALLSAGKEEEAEDRLVALPKFLGELQDAYNQ
ncbi:hypothetical protein [Gynuella sunshinyii]|uniref:Uncharacterized protein n=1 Tax=Gynuella sunshinyii YC6258 TaxID=1445510 RepID=A0A0C5W2M8_9GAMM|nr:hypothetical protein [Gynuella sunshinyii]AJQ96929.1 hypothetical Protein YC6258_04897 [Gynuella sunshinyii YC6258]